MAQVIPAISVSEYRSPTRGQDLCDMWKGALYIVAFCALALWFESQGIEVLSNSDRW